VPPGENGLRFAIETAERLVHGKADVEAVAHAAANAAAHAADAGYNAAAAHAAEAAAAYAAIAYAADVGYNTAAYVAYDDAAYAAEAAAAYTADVYADVYDARHEALRRCADLVRARISWADVESALLQCDEQ
jgi:hypothetical protein